MRNIKLTIEYDGSRYQGWQRLGKDESTNTIANKITEVIKKMTNEDIELFCGSRTEVGVHAYGQVASFKTTTDMTLIEIQHYLNRYLPMDIAITDIEEKPERFHASLNATSKIYMYRISVSEVPSVFERKYVYHSFKRPDVDLMKQAAILLVGKHDFKKFSTVKKNKSTVKEIYDIDVYDDGEELQITLHGNVLPIGGLREKSMAAYREGMKTVLIPKDNEPDLYDVDEEVKKNLTFLSLIHI